MNWRICISIAYKKSTDKFKRIMVKDFLEKENEAISYYASLVKLVLNHFFNKNVAYRCHVLSIHGTKTFETSNEFITIRFDKI